MTYYAVTDDPNELAHWGVKGMKWGVRHDKPRHTGSRRPRSAAYKKAQSKLSRMMKSGIKKAQASWRAYNSPEAKYERQTQRAMAQARKGKLKYGKLTDDQVRRITSRLALERDARSLSNTEPTIWSRLRKSVGEGLISGVGQGVGRMASERISRGSILKTDRLRAEQADQLEQKKERRRIKSAQREAERKAEREFKQQQRKDEYEYDRDRQRQEERARNAYLYGAKYDNDGKLLGDSYGSYYEQRYSKGMSLQREAANERKREERRARQEAAEQKHAYAASVKRLEAAQRKHEQTEAQKQARLDAAEKERQSRARQQWAEEIRRKESRSAAEQAWTDRNTRLYTSGRVSNPIQALGSGNYSSNSARRANDYRNTSQLRKRKRRGRN